jgi:tetratricopeptide (TPR) repeat protein
MEKLDLTPLETPEPELTYLFKHIITHQAAYESLTFDSRKRLHEQLAQFIEKYYSEIILKRQNNSLLHALAFHYGLSENRSKQREYLRKAGEAAQASYANETALEYFTQLQDLVETDADRIELHLKKGAILELVGRWPEAEVDLKEALEISEKTGAKEATVRSLIALGKLSIERSEFKPAMEGLLTAQTRLQNLDHAGLSREVNYVIGRIYSLSGDNLKAQEILDRVLLEARNAHDEQLIAEILNSLGLALVYLDDYRQARPIFEECLDRARALGKLSIISHALNNLGLIASSLGDYQAAEKKYTEGMELSRQIGDKRGILVGLVNLATVTKRLHGVKASRALYERGLSLVEEIDDSRGKVYLLNNIGVDATEAGDFTIAKRYLEQALEISRRIGDKLNMAINSLNLGYLSIKQNEFVIGNHRCLESLNAFEAINSQWGVIYCLIGLAAARAGAGDYTQAVQFAALAEKRRSTIQLQLESDGQELYDYSLATSKANLPLEAFQEAWEKGRNIDAAELSKIILEDNQE